MGLSFLKKRMFDVTIKLFYTDPKVYEWESKITNATYENGNWVITLAETAFYPEGGGQPADTGFIDGIEVVDVYKKEDEVYHLLKEKPEHTKVHCQIDAMRRIEYTQHHSGQHLLSAVCLDILGIETVSVHLSNDTATIDLNVPSLTAEQLQQIEHEVNRQILLNRKIRTFYIDKSEADRYQLNKIPPGIDRLRIVQIEGIEYNACAGTHVESTSEIGWLKLLKTEKVRGITRLFFICGIRLLKDYQKKSALINSLSGMLKTSQELLLQQTEKLKLENKDKEKKYNALFLRYADFLVDQLIEKQPNDIVIETFEDFSIKQLSFLTSKLMEKGVKIVVLGSLEDKKVSFIADESANVNCGQFIKEHAAKFSGKGGGSPTRAQASFPSEEALQAFLNFIKSVFYSK